MRVELDLVDRFALPPAENTLWWQNGLEPVLLLLCSTRKGSIYVLMLFKDIRDAFISIFGFFFLLFSAKKSKFRKDCKTCYSLVFVLKKCIEFLKPPPGKKRNAFALINIIVTFSFLL